jgi:hypothetical protein
MRFSSFAIGALLHSRSNHNSLVDAFSTPRFRSRTNLKNNISNKNHAAVDSLGKSRTDPIVLKSFEGSGQDNDPKSANLAQEDLKERLT